MRFRGILYVLAALAAFAVLLLQRNPALYSDPLFLMMPLLLTVTFAFMIIVRETDETKTAFSVILIGFATAALLYSFTKDFFFRYIGMSVFVIIAVLDVSGIILLYDVLLRRKRRKK